MWVLDTTLDHGGRTQVNKAEVNFALTESTVYAGWQTNKHTTTIQEKVVE